MSIKTILALAFAFVVIQAVPAFSRVDDLRVKQFPIR